MANEGNIFADLPGAALAKEMVTELLTAGNLRIERIVSTGQSSPPGYWYDQNWNEWVIVLSGAARLRFENEAEDRPLSAGGYVYIAAHRRHRVVWTDPKEATVWLAIHHADT